MLPIRQKYPFKSIKTLLQVIKSVKPLEKNPKHNQ